jgi:hypothetical protein
MIEFRVDDMRVELKPAEVAAKGVRCSVALNRENVIGEAPAELKLRRGDKIYLWEKNNE